MGVKHDVADFFRRTFEESGVSEHVAMFINLANAPGSREAYHAKDRIDTWQSIWLMKRECTSWSF